MPMNQKLMRPTRRRSTDSEIVDIEWTADGGGIRASLGGTVFPFNSDTATIAAAFHADYGGNPLVVDHGSSGNSFRYRVTFQDGVDKDVEMEVDGELYTAVTTELVITTTVEGIAEVAEIVGVAEVFSVSGGIDEVVTFSDGTNSGDVTFDSGGNVSAITTPESYNAGTGSGTPTASFEAQSPGNAADMAKTSGGGGTVAVNTQGVTAVPSVPGVQEVQQIDLNGANGGTWTKTGAEVGLLFSNSSAASVAVNLNSSTDPPAPPVSVLVTGSDGGPYDVTFAGVGPKDLIPTTSNLEIRTSSADTIDVAVVQEGG